MFVRQDPPESNYIESKGMGTHHRRFRISRNNYTYDAPRINEDGDVFFWHKGILHVFDHCDILKVAARSPQKLSWFSINVDDATTYYYNPVFFLTLDGEKTTRISESASSETLICSYNYGDWVCIGMNHVLMTNSILEYQSATRTLRYVGTYNKKGSGNFAIDHEKCRLIDAVVDCTTKPQSIMDKGFGFMTGVNIFNVADCTTRTVPFQTPVPLKDFFTLSWIDHGRLKVTARGVFLTHNGAGMEFGDRWFMLDSQALWNEAITTETAGERMRQQQEQEEEEEEERKSILKMYMTRTATSDEENGGSSSSSNSKSNDREKRKISRTPVGLVSVTLHVITEHSAMLARRRDDAESSLSLSVGPVK